MLRLAMDGVDQAIGWKALQIGILRQAMEAQQVKLKVFQEKRRALVDAANDIIQQSDHKRLPRLPVEIVLQIFSMLYFSDDTRGGGVIQELINDPKTPSSWVKAIRDLVPKYVWLLPEGEELSASAHDFELSHLPYSHRILGPHPKHVMGDPNGMGIRHIFVSGNPDSFGDVHRRYPDVLEAPSALFIGFDKDHQTADDRKDVLDFCHTWLSTTSILVITGYGDDDEADWEDNSWGELDDQRRILDQPTKSPTRLSEAHIHPSLLYPLQPVLWRLVELDLMFSAPDDDEAQLRYVFESLELLPTTLEKIEFGNSHSTDVGDIDDEDDLIRDLRLAALPHLRSLTFRGFHWKFTNTIMNQLHCPGVENVLLLPSKFQEEQTDFGEILSLDYLQEKFPRLRRLSVTQVSSNFALAICVWLLLYRLLNQS